MRIISSLKTKLSNKNQYLQSYFLLPPTMITIILLNAASVLSSIVDNFNGIQSSFIKKKN